MDAKMAQGGAVFKKPAMNILQECRDKQDELMTRFVLETRFEEVKSMLNKSDISIHKSGDTYIAKPGQGFDNWKIEVVRIISKFKGNCEMTSLPNTDYVSGRLRNYDSIQITKAGDKLKVCGDRPTIDKILKELDNSWNQIELVEVPLTNKEQAILYLYDLWNCSFFKQNKIDAEKKTKYDATVKLYTCTSADEKAKRQNEIKHEIGRNKVFETSKTLTDLEVRLIEQPNVQLKIDTKLNYSISSTNCAWYVDKQTATVSFFGKSKQDVDNSHKKYMNFIIQDFVKVSSRFTSTDQVNDVIDSINAKFHGSAIVYLNSKLNSVDYVCTYDDKRSVETEIKSLFTTRTVRTSCQIDFCKFIFEKLKASIESKLLVEVEAVGDTSQYRWEIKGFPDDVDKAYSELCNTVMGICSKEKTFILDEKIESAQEKVDKCCKEMTCLAKVEENKWASGGINIQEEVLYHEWVIPSLNTVRLIHSDQKAWLTSAFRAIKMETSGQSMVEFNEDWSSATIYLPNWTNGENKEKELLSSILENFFTRSRLARSSKDPLVFEMQATADWPWKKVLKVLLVTLNSLQGVPPVYICQADKRKFEKGLTIIQTFIEQSCHDPGINITVVPGELTRHKVDAVVNSTKNDLTLTFGAVSASILKSAGEEIQTQCKRIMSDRKCKLLEADEVVVTSAGNMSSCKYVFHGALAEWNKQRLPEFVYNCLHEADLRDLSTIAFPSLGTGNLKYPPQQVASIMFNTIQQYGLRRKIKQLREVMLVIYHKDYTSLKAFQKVQELYRTGCPAKEDRVKCPNPLKIKVTLTGKDPDTVASAFGAVENMLRQKEYLSEPPTQSIDRDDETNKFKEQPEGDESSMECATTGGKETTERKNSSSRRSDVEQLKPVECDGTESVDFIKFGIMDGNGQICKTLMETLKKYSIDETSLVWSPLYPQEARIKLSGDNDRKKACTMLEKEAKYERQQYEADAVINIRAQLSDKACQYLRENKDKISNLERQSGVDVLHECTTITGDLYSLSIAREILSQWISKQPRDSRAGLGNDLIDDGKSTNVKTQETMVTSMDHTIGGNKEDVSRNTGARPKEHVTSASKEPSLDDTKSFPIGGVEPDDIGKKDGYISSQWGIPKERITTSSLDNKRTSKTGGLEQYADDGQVENEDEEDVGDISGQDDDFVNLPPQFPNLADKFMLTTKENISVYIYEGQLCYLNAKGIVNSTNESMNSEFGLCKVVMQKAGPVVQQECLNEISKNGKRQQGSVFSTQAGNLHHYQRIIHVCAPVWAKRKSKEMFEKSLFNIVYYALVTADDLKLESVAFPAIGSGGRGAPKQVCFVAFAKAVQSYSGRHGKRSKIKHIHFVDRQTEVVDSLKTAFVHVLLDDDAQRELMFTKIPAKIRNTYDLSGHSPAAKAVNNKFERIIAKNVMLVLCDGPLLSAPSHKHIRDISFADSGLVIPICEDMKREGCAMALCRQRSTEEFERFLDNLRKKKMKAGDVLGMVHDKNIKFAHIFSLVMPQIDEKAQKIDQKFWKSFVTSCENVLITVDKKGVNHIVFPVLALDMYPTEAELFTAENIKTMFDVMYTFAFGRKNKRRLTIHIPTNDNAVYKMCHAVLQNCTWITKTATEITV